jgi:hypothetical protein
MSLFRQLFVRQLSGSDILVHLISNLFHIRLVWQCVGDVGYILLPVEYD